MRAHVSETQLSETETLRQLPNMLETDATSEIALDDIDSEYSTKTNEISQIRKPRRLRERETRTASERERERLRGPRHSAEVH